jgi:hypothetical protein
MRRSQRFLSPLSGISLERCQPERDRHHSQPARQLDRSEFFSRQETALSAPIGAGRSRCLWATSTRSLLRCVSPDLAHLLRAGRVRLNIRERYYIPRTFPVNKCLLARGKLTPNVWTGGALHDFAVTALLICQIKQIAVRAQRQSSLLLGRSAARARSTIDSGGLISAQRSGDVPPRC